MESKPICLSCGLCCDGTLFADVKLTAEDLARLPGANLPPSVGRERRGAARLPQPCFAWIEGKCSAYDCRPGHCRHFDCDLLMKVEAGEVSVARALEIIDECRQKAAQVKTMLRLLGNKEEHLSIAVRFQRTSRLAKKGDWDRKKNALFGDLTVAMHELHSLLAKHIYPV